MNFAFGDVTVYLKDEDDRCAIHEATEAGFEPESRAAWARIVEPGTAVIDVGAYSGLYAIAAAKLGASFVVAMEPNPENYKRALENIVTSGCNITLMERAASDNGGMATFRYNPRVPLTSGGTLHPDGPVATKKTDALTVWRMKLDDVMVVQRVSAIKIDVEQHEREVVAGAAQTIAQHRPSLLIETLTDDMRAALLAMLPDYRVEAVLDRRNTLFMPN